MSELSHFSDQVGQWLTYHGMKQVNTDENKTVYHLTIDTIGDVHIGYLAQNESIVLFADLGGLDELPDNIVIKCLAAQHFKHLPNVNFALDEASERLLVWLKIKLVEATAEMLDQLLTQLIDEGLIEFKRMLTMDLDTSTVPGVKV